MFQNSPIGLSFVDRDYRYVYVNASLVKFNGHEEDEILGRTVAEVVPHLWPALEPLYRRALEGDTTLNEKVEGIANARTGRYGYWLVSYYPVRIDEQVIGVGVIVNDITQRQEYENALKTRNDLYRMLSLTNRAVSQCQNASQLYDEVCSIAVETGHFRFAWVGVLDGGRVNMAARHGDDGGYMNDLVITLDENDPRSHGPTGRAAVTGCSYVVNDFMNSPFTVLLRDRAKQAGFAASATFPLKERGVVIAVLTLFASKVGHFSEEMVATLGEIAPSISFALDRYAEEADRRRAEASLHLRDRAMRALSQGIVITDAQVRDNPIIYASPSFEKLTGYSAGELMGRNWQLLYGNELELSSTDLARVAIDKRESVTTQKLVHCKDGRTFWSDFSISPVFDQAGSLTHFVGVQTDVTERRQLESQFRQSQKMEAIGRLAGGISHDFNNMLTLIIGCADMLQQHPLMDEYGHELLEGIIDAANRSAALTRQLLTFSRQQPLTLQVVDLNKFIAGIDKMFRRVIGEDIDLQTRLCPDISRVKVDPSQLTQALLNLVVNARDAMLSGGEIVIETTSAVFTHEDCRVNPERVPGDYVQLRVIDNGCGMTPEVTRRVFEPFFTTKPAGKGTGLGLAVVHGIIKQCHGIIEIESEPAKGTVIKIFLPCEKEAVISVPISPAPDKTAHGTETILLVEDESTVRKLIRRLLERKGYMVLDACDGVEAIRLATDHAAPIHLLITDVVMPNMGGSVVAECVLKIHPNAAVLYISGYLDDAVLQQGILTDRVNFLQKPFNFDGLANKVHSILHQTVPSA